MNDPSSRIETMLASLLAGEPRRHDEQVRDLRNSLAAALALVRRLARQDEDSGLITARAESFALARLRATEHPRGAELEPLIRSLLARQCGDASSRISLIGPSVRLLPAAAGLVALVMHDLASGGPGDTTMLWCLAYSGTAMELSWQQAGMLGEPAQSPEWLEPAFTYDLRGSLTVDRGDGWRNCTIILPGSCFSIES